jgi:hypothetical protein
VFKFICIVPEEGHKVWPSFFVKHYIITFVYLKV